MVSDKSSFLLVDQMRFHKEIIPIDKHSWTAIFLGLCHDTVVWNMRVFNAAAIPDSSFTLVGCYANIGYIKGIPEHGGVPYLWFQFRERVAEVDVALRGWSRRIFSEVLPFAR
ncbi:hypothetical protein U1Q18_045589, partial [Sarracenia purpurea var. burkii]